MNKKKYILLILLVAVFVACERDGGRVVRSNGDGSGRFIDEIRLKTTPVKDQGRSRLCWIYSMLATVETDRLMLGDSVNLSPTFLERCMLIDQSMNYYLTRGSEDIDMGGMGGMALNLIERFGAMPFDSYWLHKDVNHNVLARKAMKIGQTYIYRQGGIHGYIERVNGIFDEELGYLPSNIYMFRMEYSPKQFGGSVYKSGSYEALTSFTHHPFGERFALEVPDNTMKIQLLNVPIDTLMNEIEGALYSGHAVCWEGDISEEGFSFADGIADIPPMVSTSQSARQIEFENFETTDDHCMELVGIAHDLKGRRYFIAKNSWGTNNPYHGFMYISFNYVRLKTIAAFFLKKNLEPKDL